MFLIRHLLNFRHQHLSLQPINLFPTLPYRLLLNHSKLLLRLIQPSTIIKVILRFPNFLRKTLGFALKDMVKRLTDNVCGFSLFTNLGVVESVSEGKVVGLGWRGHEDGVGARFWAFLEVSVIIWRMLGQIALEISASSGVFHTITLRFPPFRNWLDLIIHNIKVNSRNSLKHFLWWSFLAFFSWLRFISFADQSRRAIFQQSGYQLHLIFTTGTLWNLCPWRQLLFPKLNRRFIAKKTRTRLNYKHSMVVFRGVIIWLH